LDSVLELKGQSIRANDKFSKYGLESVEIAEVTGLINDTFKIDISSDLFFEFFTITEFTNYLVEEYSEEITTYYA
jgi:acyl carrier protein